ncbi:MAG: DNA repair protein RecN [Candidatus Aureabacteria bacterium]|nr:DNA repair protein RecN [Candidatus Auribacterota bacterium]
MNILLRTLRVENIGIIESLSIEFGDGLNVLTGETGAGKSLVLNSFNMILGERVSAETVLRTGQEEASIEAVFELNGRSPVTDFLKTIQIPQESDDIWIKRVITRSGRNRSWINAHAVSLSVLKELGHLMADMCGNHAHQELLNAENHIVLLDKFCQNDDVIEKWDSGLKDYTSLLQKMRELDQEERLKNEKLMIYQMQKDELKVVAELKDPEEELLKKHSLMADAENVSRAVHELLSLVSSEDHGLIERFRKTLQACDFLSRYRSDFVEYKKEIESSMETLVELQREAESFSEGMDFSGEEMEKIEETLSQVKRLKSKYQKSLEELKDYRQELDEKIRILDNISVEKEDIERSLKKMKSQVIKVGKVLSQKRKAGALKLEKLIEKELSELSIKNVKFEVRIFTEGRDGIPYEKAEFYIQTNVGEEIKPLKDITSSGEVSRIMLSLKKIFSDVDKIPILIFDEIDSNIGGETALVVGSKLCGIKKSHQLIVITHMPQIAKFSDWHLSVRKREIKGRTAVFVSRLKGEERVKEIARMMGGEKITSVVKKHAEELIKQGGNK